MTKAHSEAGDNGGRCESCDRPETEFETQVTYPVLLAGLGMGTMWLCPKCFCEHEARDEARQVSAPLVTPDEPWGVE